MAGAVRTQAYQNLLKELIRLRQEAGFSQAALAKDLGKPPSYVGKFELGERRLDVIELIVILKALGADVEAFIEQVLLEAPDQLGA